jgi:hypothetical protein
LISDTKTEAMEKRTLNMTTGCYLLAETREMISRCYSDFVTTVVTEIKKNGTLIYIIQLENRNRLTKLRISNGKFDWMENHSKH